VFSYKRFPALFYLAYGEEKEELLKSSGLDVVISLPFNQALADQTAEEFLMCSPDGSMWLDW